LAKSFATQIGVGLPPDHMFRATPADEDWHEPLSGQDRLAVGPEEALQVTRAAWSAART
jgi:hypothetical protein